MSAPDLTSLDERGMPLFRQLGQSATASSALAALYLPVLCERLAALSPQVDPHLCEEAAGEAILSLLERPSSYDPDRLGLCAYLLMSARGDLLNALARERRHWRGRQSLDSVEQGPEAGNYLGRDDDPALRLMAEEESAARAPPAEFLEGLNPQQRRCWELMCAGEHSYEVHARECGLSHLPPRERKRAVKRLKDTVSARRKRAEGNR
jgi:DNA-directed RNA polymerase specialized sigma24 family protein